MKKKLFLLGVIIFLRNSYKISYKLVIMIGLLFFLIQPLDLMSQNDGHWILTDIVTGKYKDHKERCFEEKFQASEGSVYFFKRYFKGVCNHRKEDVFSATATWTRPPTKLKPGETIPLNAKVIRESNILGGLSLGHGVDISIDDSHCGCGSVCSTHQVIGRAMVYTGNQPASSQLNATFKVPQGSDGESFAIRFCISPSSYHNCPGWRYIYKWTSDPNKNSAYSDTVPPNTNVTSNNSHDGFIKHGTGKSLSCVWNSYSPDKKSFSTQPGGVFPLRRNFATGKYLVHIGASGLSGVDLSPEKWNTYGPFLLKGRHKYRAIINSRGNIPGNIKIQGIPYLTWEEEHYTLSMYSKPDPGQAIVYARNNIRGNMWYAICLERVQSTQTAVKIFSTNNNYGVRNGPGNSTVFSINRPYYISQIVNYHYNRGKGDEPGMISLKDSQGRVYGPWRAFTKNPDSTDSRRYWTVAPKIVLGPGSYTVIDSNPSTWAINSISGQRGMTLISGWESEGKKITLKAKTYKGFSKIGYKYRGINFFESGSGLNSEVKAIYKDNFYKSNVRYIYTRISFKNNFFNIKDQTIKIEIKYFKPDGSLWGTIKKNVSVSKNLNTASYRKGGWGWKTRGKWNPGKYNVKIYFNNIYMGSSFFKIY